ncbi:MAG: xylulose kinase [Desulfobacteraceae bacterium]|nr:MAG: xylulose kinase [Desulfobacteraceae bacterium]
MSAKEKYILCIDLGTSGCKAAVFTIQGEFVGFDFTSVPLHLIPPGGAEQDPNDWWSAIRQSTRRLLQNHPVRPEEIAAVSVNTQWSGTVAVDQNGRHLMNALIWLDTRGAKQVKDIKRSRINLSGFGVGKLYRWLRWTGGAPSRTGKDPLAHILYIKEQHPDLYRATYKFMEVKDYINLRLTGKFLATCDSITLHWLTDNRDLSRIDYHPALLKISGLPREKFPDLVEATDIIGNLSRPAGADLGLPASVKVVGGSPDMIAAAIGSGAVRDYEAHSYLGTSSWLSAHVPYKKTDLGSGVAALPSAIPNRYFIANEQETAGNCLNFLRDNILYHPDELLREDKAPDIFKIFDREAATAPPGANGLIFTPWLFGERTPVDNHLIRGGWHNLSLTNSRADVIRSCLEGVALNQKWALGAVEKFMRRETGPISIVGGGANSDIWCQIHADVLGRPIRQVADPILANARGSAFIAAVALGEMRFEDIPGRIKIKQTYHPNPDHRELYDAMFKEFVNIYHANKEIHARLNRRKR